jgi:hypothetical protein
MDPQAVRLLAQVAARIEASGLIGFEEPLKRGVHVVKCWRMLVAFCGRDRACEECISYGDGEVCEGVLDAVGGVFVFGVHGGGLELFGE